MVALRKSRSVALLSALAWLCQSRPSAAADSVNECIAAHAGGQVLRNQGRLVAAKARFAECQVESCPALVRDECAALGQSVDQALPSAVFGALDEQGKPTSDAALSIDGLPALTRLDGRPIPLDPGAHRVRFQRANGEVRDLTLVLVESEHERRVLADFRPPPDSANADGEHANGRGTRRALVWASAGTAALALGSFTYFALSGRAIQSDLERCKPSCQNRDDLDSMHARYLVADVSLGVALLSLGVGALVWAKNPALFAQSSRQPAPPVALRVQPSVAPHSAGLWAQGEF